MLSENTLLWLKERTGLNMLECCLSSLVSADSLSPAFCLKESFFLYNIAKYFSLFANLFIKYVRVFDTKTWNSVLEIESNYFETEEDNECFNETEYWPKLEVSVAFNEKVLAIGFGKKVKVWQKETIPADKPRCIE